MMNDTPDDLAVRAHADEPVQRPRVSPELMALIRANNQAGITQAPDGLSRLEGGLAVHCRVDLESRRVVEAASMASLFRGYEALLPGRDLQQVGRVSSIASSICGGVHATASALCLEMALGLAPPPLGIVLRNLLLSCQYLNDNCMHLFVLAGPDYSQLTIAATNPELWPRAQKARCRFSAVHGRRHVGDILLDLNKGTGALYQEAIAMTLRARQAYAVLGGKYPHSESIIPGGVAVNVDAGKLQQFEELLSPFAAYAHKTAALWDDVFDFMLDANPRYQQCGRSDASMLDFGQWDHPDFYDGRYANCDLWGQNRWATPGVVINGSWRCGQMSLLNAGIEEHLNHSYQAGAPVPVEQRITHDPNGHPISPLHPWNKAAQPPQRYRPEAYSWGSSLTWRGLGFEVGTHARLYLTALAQKSPASRFVNATGTGLEFMLPLADGAVAGLHWNIPAIWNTFERNRARAYSLAFNLAVTRDNVSLAQHYLRTGETHTHVSANPHSGGLQLGVGLWGASRGFLAHWAVIRDRVIANYQIAIPSRVNMGTCTPDAEPGPLEKALLNTPITESGFSGPEDFSAIDISRTIQSFDPCMSCSAHLLIDGVQQVLVKGIDTRFPV